MAVWHRRIPAMEGATPLASHVRSPNVTGFFSVLASFQTSAASASGSEILFPRYARTEHLPLEMSSIAEETGAAGRLNPARLLCRFLAALHFSSRIDRVIDRSSRDR
jgi:hypothetical protein